LKEELDIPVMHDDQHGTAIISSAALLNALELANKKIEDVVIVISGAGAAAMSCAKLYTCLGAKLENIYMFDSRGLLHAGRKDLEDNKLLFGAHTTGDKSLQDMFVNADVFVGLSKGNLVSKEMIASMAENPIVFALANPEPEISYKDAISVRKDIIMATGRSDHPNQVNNVLGFPFIFRGALDVRATTINEEMKLAAVQAIASLAKESIPEEVAICVRENKGFDFGAWSQVMSELDFGKVDRLYWVNDSIYGPLNDESFNKLIDRVRNSKSDFIGLTFNKKYFFHLQSYFLVFNKKILKCD
jgi:malate dehydrogenase (oxaloacetate-decarboxylating)(NADP+)